MQVLGGKVLGLLNIVDESCDCALPKPNACAHMRHYSMNCKLTKTINNYVFLEIDIWSTCDRNF